MKTSHRVTIDGLPNTLIQSYVSGNGDIQYNTEGNKSGHTFRRGLNRLPKNTPIKTNGHTYVILD